MSLRDTALDFLMWNFLQQLQQVCNLVNHQKFQNKLEKWRQIADKMSELDRYRLGKVRYRLGKVKRRHKSKLTPKWYYLELWDSKKTPSRACVMHEQLTLSCRPAAETFLWHLRSSSWTGPSHHSSSSQLAQAICIIVEPQMLSHHTPIASRGQRTSSCHWLSQEAM